VELKHIAEEVELNLLIVFLVSWGGVRLSPLGRQWWMSSGQWNENWQVEPKYSKKFCTSATLSTTNPTWADLGLNTGRRGWKPATNRLSYGTVPNISLRRKN
jgi:hypothetical protein